MTEKFEKVKPDIEIRIAVPDESEAIAGVLHAAFAEFEPQYTAEAFAATTPKTEKIRERFAEGKTWVVLKNEKIVGTVSTVPEDEKLYIRSMAVAPSAQGFGIGRKLLETVENYAVENGFEYLFLYTTPFLSGAIRIYERNGFERGEDVGGFFGTPLFAMEKKLV